jgi:hypothetical protein
MGRFIQHLPSDGIRTRIAYQRWSSGVAYWELDPTTSNVLSFAPIFGTDVGRYLRLGSAGGNAALAWYDPVARGVRTTTCNGSTCSTPWGVDGGTADVGRDLAMSITPTATRLAYWDATNDLLKLATAATPAGPFTFKTMAGSPGSISIVGTGTGVPLVAFTIGSSPNLWMVTP